jgi:signal peptidase I
MDEPTKPAAPQEAEPAQQTGGVKDTIESILVAFILAFIFRAFVVEAFVIPTGSMAPTLLGAHMRFRCADCGYEFTVNYSAPRSDSDDVNIPKYAETQDVQTDAMGRKRLVIRPKVVAAYCPNCGFRIGDEELADPKHEVGIPAKGITGPAVHYGDRILVLKYQYIFQPPQRWDVVVFKAPPDPELWHYSQNYIKRLVGRPGETLLILDGDVYASQGSTDIDAFKICPKPPAVQEALWRVVYDNDYHPQGLLRHETRSEPAHKWVQPWMPVTDNEGWDLTGGPSNGRIFRFNNPAGAGTLTFNPQVDPEKHALTDWLAYDVATDQDRVSRMDYVSRGGGENNVSDLKLELYYKKTAGSGPLRMSMSKQDRTFIAEVSDNSVRLLSRTANSAEAQIGQPATLPATTGPRHVELLNADYRVTIRIDGSEVIATTPADYHPDPRKLMEAYQTGQAMPPPTVQIAAEKQTCELSHIKLWRDVYYINRPNSGLNWAIPENFPNKLIHLASEKGKEEYFVLGDNSIISGDARYWNQPINLPNEDLVVESGRVPERFMLGKAFFVYWPAGYRPFRDAPGMIPDFGDMRFIH